MIDIFTQLAAFNGIGQEWFLSAVLVFLRVGGALAVMPAFGEQVVPRRVRLVLVLAFTAIVAPAVAPDMGAIPAPLRAGLIEVLIGLALGISMRLFIFALQIAELVGAQAGGNRQATDVEMHKHLAAQMLHKAQRALNRDAGGVQRRARQYVLGAQAQLHAALHFTRQGVGFDLGQ